MKEMSISEKATYNIQTREEFEIIKKKLGYDAEHQLREYPGTQCRFDGYLEFVKSANMLIEFVDKFVCNDAIEGIFICMENMGLNITNWHIHWDTKTISIRFNWR